MADTAGFMLDRTGDVGLTDAMSAAAAERVAARKAKKHAKKHAKHKASNSYDGR